MYRNVTVGQEGEITLQLTAPEATGRFVSYFRLKTADGGHFGQRFWADVRVVEEENGWHVVNGVLAGAIKSTVGTHGATTGSPIHDTHDDDLTPSPLQPVDHGKNEEEDENEDGEGEQPVVDNSMSSSEASVVAVR